MNILINAFDSSTEKGPFPNLACMKIARYHKLKGDEVALVGAGLTKQDPMPDPDIVYVSCIFDWNGPQARGTKWLYPNADFRLGGSGVDLETTLPPEIDLCSPDYEIYNNRGIPGWPFAMGFSTRGCNRKCSFCIVPQKEGKITMNGALGMKQILQTAPKEAQDRLLLLDNNFVQSPTVRDDLAWLAQWGGQVNYSQGIDARVIDRDPELASLLAATNFRGRTFAGKLLTSAYDWPQLSKIITRSVQHFKDAGINIRQNLQFYVLVNYDSPFEQDLERVNHLRDMGTNAYVMIYDKKHCDAKYRHLARWANSWQLFHNIEWADYRPAMALA